jgi:hypothetical protein
MHRRLNPELKALLAEACDSLARLDADRLESITGYCEELIAIGPISTVTDEAVVDRDLAIFERVLEATRANLQVMRRLREITEAQEGYNPVLAECKQFAEGERGIY